MSSSTVNSIPKVEANTFVLVAQKGGGGIVRIDNKPLSLQIYLVLTSADL